jgi:predicted Zn-dependent protease
VFRTIVTALFVVFVLVGTRTSFAAERQDARARYSEVAKTVRDVEEDIKAESKLGRQIAAIILGRYPLYNRRDIKLYVSRVGHSLTYSIGRKELQYYFSVVETDDINAYATPGGYIFITTGLLKELRDESELAAVLAHEIVHVNKRHIIKALNVQGFADSEQRGIVTFIGGAAVSTRVAFTQAVDSAMDVLFSQGLHHENEFESDRLAVQILYQVGYDPNALSRVLTRLSHLGHEHLDVIRKTHPDFQERLNNLAQSDIAQMKTSEEFKRVKTRFEKNTAGL